MNANRSSALFFVVLGLSLLGACSQNPPEIKVKLALVQVSTVDDSSDFFATLQSPCSVILHSRVDGHINKILVKPGTQVTKGTVMIQVEPAKQRGKDRYSEISSPCTGTVGEIRVNEGEYVDTSTQLTTVTQNKPLEVNIRVPSGMLTQFSKGMPVELMDTDEQSIIGTSRIFFISPEVHSETQTVLVKSLFDNSKGQLRSGQAVRVRVAGQKRPAILIPTTAVTFIAGKTYVYVAQTQEQTQLIARQKPVELGEITGNNYQVIQGLQPGEKIVVSELAYLSDGATITPEP